jgi:hypothetical protein
MIIKVLGSNYIVGCLLEIMFLAKKSLPPQVTPASSLRNPPFSQQDKDKQKSTEASNKQTDNKITGGLKQSPCWQ